MKVCPYCAEEILSAAIVCKHCRRDIVSAAVDPIRKKSLLPVLLGAPLAVLFVGWLASAMSGGASSGLTMLDVSVRFSGLELEVTNDTPAAAGQAVTVYINGTPPSGYRQEVTLPAAGKRVLVPLGGFAKKDGERFTPLTHQVTVVWIGGGGYDYRQFSK